MVKYNGKNNKYKCTLIDLKDLVDKKLNEDIILSIYLNKSIVEIHKKDETGRYRVRYAKLPKDNFNKVVKKELYYKMTDWRYISDDRFMYILIKSRNYLEDLFFEL